MRHPCSGALLGSSSSGNSPAIIPDLYHAVFDPDRKRCGRLIGRRSQGFPGFDRKTSAVARTNDLVIFDATTGQHAAVMGTDILDRIERLAQLEHRDGGAIYFDTNFKDFGLLTILNCLMVNNSTLKGGGIITLDRNSNLLLMNSTLSLNKGSSQGAVIASLGKVPAKSYIVNTIISGNEGGTLFSIEGEAEYVSTTNKLISPNVWVHFVNSLFENRSTGMQVQRNFDRKKWRTINDLNESVMGTNCLQGDPEFVDPDNGNFRLENGSRARNAGNLTYFFPFNIEGSNRDISKISLGCY